MKHVATLFIVILSMLYARGQQVQKSTYENVLLTKATVHTITEGTLTDTDVHIVDGRIAAVGVDITAPAGTTIIDCSDHHIYPGFIDSGTRLGLIEVGAVSLTNDYNEIGDIIPQMQALTAVNPNSVSIPVTRVNGVTTALAVPSGGIFPGTAGLIHLQGYTPEQMSAGFEGVVMNFPSSGKRGRWDRRSEDDIKKAKEKALKKITEVWDELAVYHKIDSAAAATNQSFDRYQPEMSALLPVYRGEQKLLINVNKDDDIIAAIEWISETGVDAILVGVAEGYRVAEEIAEAGVPVITGPVLSIPGRSSARYDVNYKNAGVMQQAGVKVAIQTTDAENVRNLPFNAGFAATYGMGIEEALKAITIAPAEIFGIDDEVGSIETGKLANLFVSDGDPFEMKTRIKYLFIKGWNIPMESRHTLLYEEFIDRSPGLEGGE